MTYTNTGQNCLVWPIGGAATLAKSVQKSYQIWRIAEKLKLYVNAYDLCSTPQCVSLVMLAHTQTLQCAD